ncbi:hypothetical protein C8A05DRAFT_17347, partial [Staphylotrichum tortipilum]
GATPFVSYTGDATPDEATFFLDPALLYNTTISSLLSDPSFVATQTYAQRHLDHNLALLLHEIPAVDILRVPTLFKDVTYPWPTLPDGHPPRLHAPVPGERQLKSLLPQAINRLVLGEGRKYLALRQWGPVVGGRDVFVEKVEEVYGAVGMGVVWVDDYMSHHVRGGEVHCGTNALREVGHRGWWEGGDDGRGYKVVGCT